MEIVESSQENKIERVNSVSPSFCLAKWLQVTLDLAHGTNHSCHHPKRHKIPLEGLKENPSLLHNTPYKKKVRKMMLDGVRPKECEYCWQLEDVSGYASSDRMIKSLDPWAYSELEKVSNAPWDADILPQYVEVMFDKTCNLACGYCIADISSKIEAEIEKFGPYELLEPHRLSRNKLVSRNEKENPYISAFWNWLPDLVRSLRVLRVTGGEPLLSKNAFELLEYFSINPAPNLTLVFNTNLSLPAKIIDRFLEKLDRLMTKRGVGSFEIYTSVDTHGEQAEYIRKGLSYELLLTNIEKIKSKFPKTNIVINSTYGVYSIPGFEKFLKDVYQLKMKLGGITLDISYLSHPKYLRANIVTPDIHSMIEKSFNFMNEHRSDDNDQGFTDYEINKFKRVMRWAVGKQVGDSLSQNRADFYTFITQFDERYNECFLSIFPEYEGFWKYCKKAFVFVKKLTIH
jgi:organic radical activating enzyme